MADNFVRKNSRRRTQDRRKPYAWLGTGAVGLGLGAAAICGAGTANADEGADTTSAPSRASSQETTADRQEARPSVRQSPQADRQQAGSRRGIQSGTNDEPKTSANDGETFATHDDAFESARSTLFSHRKGSTDAAKGSVATQRVNVFEVSTEPVRAPLWQRQADTSPSTDPAPATLLLSTTAAAAPPRESAQEDSGAKTVAALKTSAAATNQPIEVRQEFDNLGELQSYTSEYNRTWVLNVPSWSTLSTSSPDYVPGSVFPYRVVRPQGDTLGGTDIPAELRGLTIPNNLYVIEFQSFNGISNPAPTTLVLSIQRLDSTHSADVVEKFVYDPVQTWNYSQIWAFEFDPFLGEDAAPKAPMIKNVTATGEVYGSIDLLVSGGEDDNGIVSYQILKGGQLLTTVTPGQKYTDYGLQSGVTYTYTARSVDTIGQVSVASAPLVITTKDVVAPTAPFIASSRVTSHSVTLTAYDGTDNVGVVGYNIYRDGVRINVAPVLKYQPVIDDELDFDVTYTYTARALDAAFNESEDSRSISVTTLTPAEDRGPWRKFNDFLLNQIIPDQDENNSLLEVFFESTMNVLSLIPGGNVLAAFISVPVNFVQLLVAGFSGNADGRNDELKDLLGFGGALGYKKGVEVLKELRLAYLADRATRV